MDNFPVFRVQISIEKGSSWDQHFIGRPEKKDVLAALEDEWLLKRANINQMRGGRQMLKSRLDNLIRLVEDNEWPEGSMTCCTYAGLTVGTIRVDHVSKAIWVVD